jgi:hypothetical protein
MKITIIYNKKTKQEVARVNGDYLIDGQPAPLDADLITLEMVRAEVPQVAEDEKILPKYDLSIAEKKIIESFEVKKKTAEDMPRTLTNFQFKVGIYSEFHVSVEDIKEKIIEKSGDYKMILYLDYSPTLHFNSKLCIFVREKFEISEINMLKMFMLYNNS